MVRMTEQTPNDTAEQTADAAGQTAKRTSADALRFVPPVAALGTAFVLQVIVITDTVGTSLADRYGSDAWYVVAAVLGVAVASCAEGGAAYLMDLYDRHLLARDSVWLLRLAMLGYVAGSALVIHWWTGQRGLPEVVSWLLAGMSASALFLWSRGSRWRNREAMRAAGQLDPALPRLSAGAKLLHPIRWIVTLWLVSWEPVQTTAEARARYEQWRTERVERKTARAERNDRPSGGHPVAVETSARNRRQQTLAASETPLTTYEADAEQDATNVRPISSARRSNGRASDDEAKTLARIKKKFDTWQTGMPSVRDIAGLLGKSLHTGQKYQRLLIAELAAQTPSSAREPEDPEERALAAPVLQGATA